MITIYTMHEGVLRATSMTAAGTLPPDTMWIDLFQPDADEERQVESALGIDVPTREEMVEIEVSSRLYQDNGALYMTATLLSGAETDTPVTQPVTFMLIDGRLVTLRYIDPQPFRMFAAQAARQGVRSGQAALTGLLDAVVDRLADILERVQGDHDALSREIFARKSTRGPIHFEILLRRISLQQGLTSRVRESLVSVGRMVGFLARPGEHRDKTASRNLKTLARDVTSLSDHASYLSSNITFLLDATLGLINIEQTGIIKIFSVAAVVFLPPTLIASLYGMNFRFMPELDWRLGYPLAIVLMVASAITPYLFFKRKGWL
ncbi:MAG: magnesium transporter CorA family protein [Gammaproteobacteria bacterium]